MLDDPPVDAIFGLHVDPGLETGRVGLRYGQRNASADALRVVIHGRSAHGAYPSGGVDAIVAAAHVVTALQSVVSRNLDARDSAVVTIGVIQGGTQRNILASRVELQGTVRCLDAAGPRAGPAAPAGDGGGRGGRPRGAGRGRDRGRPTSR